VLFLVFTSAMWLVRKRDSGAAVQPQACSIELVLGIRDPILKCWSRITGAQNVTSASIIADSCSCPEKAMGLKRSWHVDSGSWSWGHVSYVACNQPELRRFLLVEIFTDTTVPEAVPMYTSYLRYEDICS
jgi:hypothetical protein